MSGALPTDFEQAMTFSRTVLQNEPGEYRLIHPKTGKIKSYWGALDEDGFGGLAVLNAKGYGVFAVINRLDPTVEQRIENKEAARNADVTGIRSLFVDIDEEAEPGENLRKVLAAPLRPSLVVRSSLPHKLQVYWFADGINTSEFKTLQLTLIGLFGADDSCKNSARILRVPGFYHTKNEPIMCSIIECDKTSAACYSRNQIFEAWPELPEALRQEAERERERAQARERLLSDRAPIAGDHARRYAMAGLANECDAVASAKEPGRNNTLNRAAFAGGQLVGAGALDRQEAEAALEAAADLCGLSAHEAAKTIRSGLEAGIKEPRDIPEPKQRKGIRARMANNTSNDTNEDQAQNLEPPSDLLTEFGNAWRLHKALRDRIAYSAGLGWLLYVPERGVWEVEPGTERLRRVVTEGLREVLEAEKAEINAKLQVANRAYQKTKSEKYKEEAKHLEDRERKLKAWIASCENHNRISNTLKQAEGVFWQPASLWDGNLDIFVCTNGVLHLQTGELKLHSPHYYATKSAGAAYAPGATHLAFDKVLDLLKQEGDRYNSISRSAGSLLHAGNPNEKMWTLQGDAGTSKGTFITAIAAAMGDYAQALDVSALLEADRRQGKAAPRPDLLKLRGARFVFSAQEPPKYAKLDAGAVKGMTGNDPITVRGLYERAEVSFLPQFKVWVHTNFPIRVDWDDVGFVRRLIIWPFNVKPDVPDLTIKATLQRDEAAKSAVLAWLVEQHQIWRTNGYDLGESESVDKAVAAYWRDVNPFTDFAEECLVFYPSKRAPKKLLREVYTSWCDKNGRKATNNKELINWLTKHGITEGRTGAARYWQGVGILQDATPGPLPTSARAKNFSDISDKSDTFTDKPPGSKGEEYIEDFLASASLSSQMSQDPPKESAGPEGERDRFKL